jgi:hypothetical protein
MKKCCGNCFEDILIKKYIINHSKIKGKCSYCYRYNKPLIEPTDLASFILDGIMRAYKHVNNTDYIPAHEAWYPSLYSLKEILKEEAGISPDNSDKYKELIEDLVGAVNLSNEDEYFKVHELDIDQYDHSISTWENFKNTIKHENRYFGSSKLDNLSLLRAIIEQLKKSATVIKGNIKIWRARIINEKFDKKISKKIILSALGPPPIHKTSNSRMSPKGIVYFYAGDDIDTCLAEIKPDVGSEVWLGCFYPRKRINVLDLTKEISIEIHSVFDQAYDPNDYYAEEFLKGFVQDIVKPIDLKESLIEYIPTQVFAEYIRDNGFEGIKYNSSQNNGGANYVLFFNNNQNGCDAEDYVNQEELNRNFKNWLWLKELLSFDIIANSYSYHLIRQPRIYKKNILAKKKIITNFDFG